jgi:Na+-transporting NADH:ubiquinone oxidoreductase subunit C
MLARPNDSRPKTLFVALTLALVCSVLVSVAAVGLRPLQQANAAADLKRNLLIAGGLLEERDASADIDALFARVEPRVVDLDTGEYADDVDPATYDARAAARDPHASKALDRRDDIAGIKRRERYATVYLVREGERLEQVILPVRGYGLWSTMYGFLSIEADLDTVVGLKFYEQGETAGLGAEVDNPDWRGKWSGKRLRDRDGRLAIAVVKGRVDPQDEAAPHQVDGLAGATLTARGVSNLLRYWLGEQGFGAYLDRMAREQGRRGES